MNGEQQGLIRPPMQRTRIIRMITHEWRAVGSFARPPARTLHVAHVEVGRRYQEWTYAPFVC